MTTHPTRDFDMAMRDSEDFRKACDQARRKCNELADALFFLAKVIKDGLKKYEKARCEMRREQAKKDGKKWMEYRFTITPNYTRARAVARVMTRAAAWCRSAGKVCDKAYRVYLKNYAGDIAENRGQTFGKAAAKAAAQQEARRTERRGPATPPRHGAAGGGTSHYRTEPRPRPSATGAGTYRRPA